MADTRTVRPTFAVGIGEDPKVVGALRFTFVPKSIPHAEGPREFIVSVQDSGHGVKFNWIKSPNDESMKDLFEETARQRLSARAEWLGKLRSLMGIVKGWGDELGWATKLVEKKMADPEIGNYRTHGLLLQKETVRLFLEPVARIAPGADGVVDLCSMPSYDDIASLYYYGGKWNVHYMFEGTPSVGDIREAEAKPLTKATLRKVFDEMKANAE